MSYPIAILGAGGLPHLSHPCQETQGSGTDLLLCGPQGWNNGNTSDAIPAGREDGMASKGHPITSKRSMLLWARAPFPWGSLQTESGKNYALPLAALSLLHPSGADSSSFLAAQRVEECEVRNRVLLLRKAGGGGGSLREPRLLTGVWQPHLISFLLHDKNAIGLPREDNQHSLLSWTLVQVTQQTGMGRNKPHVRVNRKTAGGITTWRARSFSDVPFCPLFTPMMCGIKNPS